MYIWMYATQNHQGSKRLRDHDDDENDNNDDTLKRGYRQIHGRVTV